MRSLNGGAFTSTTATQSGLADGSYRFRVVVTAAILVVVDNTAPAAGTLALANLTDTGSADIHIARDNGFDLNLTGAEANTTVA